jgi:acetyl esterase
MTNRPAPLLLLLLVLSTGLLFAESTSAPPRSLKDSGVTVQPGEKRLYKEVGGKRLEIWIWKPAGWKPRDQRSAILLFHGGSWRGGSPMALARQAEQLAQGGMMVFSVQYRLISEPGVTVYDCVKDAKSAFRWVVARAQELGVGRHRIAAGGSSAGGHLAAALATLAAINDPADDTSVPTVPAALVLFAPAVQLDGRRVAEAAGARSPDEMAALSPYHHVSRGHPPTLILHGEADTTVPIRTAREYAAKVRQLAGRCTVVGFADQGHGFHQGEPHLRATMQRVGAFLREERLLE